MKIYISGRITGDPGFKQKFALAEEKIRGARPEAVVLNPAILPAGLAQGEYMRICLAMIDASDLLVLLPDWAESEGALIEEAYADKCGKRVFATVEAPEEWEVPACRKD